jgi:hypothetical protein
MESLRIKHCPVVVEMHKKDLEYHAAFLSKASFSKFTSHIRTSSKHFVLLNNKTSLSIFGVSNLSFLGRRSVK